MSEYIKIGLQVSWLIIIVYWVVSSKKVKKVIEQESSTKRFFFYILPFIIAILLLGPGKWFGHSLIRENFVPHTNFVGIIGLMFCFSGVLIACYSRYKLGDNWSLSVQKKENHELIQSGIYSIIRHPIYSGLLLLFIGNAIIVGDYRGIIAVIIIFISFWLKLLKEERYLISIFGNQYLAYKEKTKALIPFLI
jgi:protein-S-isoprenylcysteine O-methyltransferase Ste14